MATAAVAAATRHVVAVPYPGRGHINPMLVVCRLLAAADSALTITVVVTEEWLALLASAGVPPHASRARPLRHHPQRHPLRARPRRRPRRIHRGRARQDGGASRAAARPAGAGAEAGGHRGRHLPDVGGGGRRAAGDTGVLAVDHASHLLLGTLPHGPVAAGGWRWKGRRSTAQPTGIERVPRRDRRDESHTPWAEMAAPAADETRMGGCHIVAVPFPGRGHVNAMMNLSRLLAARGAVVTFVVTEEWLGLLLRSSPNTAPAAGVRLRTIPNVIPSEHGRAADHAGFLDAVATEMEAPFERLLDGLEGPPPAALVADSYLPWVVGVGNRRGVPVWSLFPMAAAFFSAYYHYDRLPASLTDEHAPASGETVDNSDQKLEHYISGRPSSSIRLSDLEPLIHNKRTVKHIRTAVSSIRNAQCLLFTTMYELETSVINSLQSILSCPIYPIGPCVSYMTLEDHHTMSNGEITSQGDYFTWLDSQPVNSVLYVSLGSFLSVTASQLDEIALGLASSDVRFLWILREQFPRVRELIGGTNKGMILPWCEQLKVLCHHSVGGFLTHCGMNSTLEAVFAGVPMLALPLFFDQPIDGRLIVEEWKIGLNLKDCTRKDGLIGREDIARAAKRLMSTDEAEIKAIRRRSLEWKETSRRAVDRGGSSYCNLSSLMEMVCTPQ